MQLETLSVYEIRLLEIRADIEYIQANIRTFAGVDTECLEDTKVLATYGLHMVHREEWRALHNISHKVDPAVKFLIPEDTCLPEKPVGEQYLGCYHTKQIKRLSEYWSRADLEGGAFRQCANLANKHGQRFFGLGGGTSMSRFTVGHILCFTLPANISRENLTEPQYGYGVCGSECPNETSKWCGFASRSVRQKVALYHRDLPEVKWEPASARQRARERAERAPAFKSSEVPDGFEYDSFEESFEHSDADSPLPGIQVQRPDGSRYQFCRGPNCRHPGDADGAPPGIADQTRLEPSDGPWDPATSGFDAGTRPIVTIHRSASPAALCRWSFFPLSLLLAS
jgi:hypothetical protein